MGIDVAISKCGSYDIKEVRAALEKILNEIGGIDFIKPGMKVALKVNLISFLKPEAAGTTHPAVVCAMCDILREKGAEVIVGDSPGGLYTQAYVDKVYNAAGMKEVLEHGAKLNYDFGTAEAVFDDGRICKSFTYTSYLKDCDYIINMSKLKSHGMMVMSAAVKNMFGAIPGLVKPEYHYRFSKQADFAKALIDIYEYFSPCINITDAVEGMEGNGPTAGTPRKLGLLLASKNAFLLDRVNAHIINFPTENVPTVSESVRLGLAPEDVKSINCSMDIDSIRAEDFKPAVSHSLTFDGNGWFGKMFGKFAESALKTRPKLYKNKCVGCKECYKICPAKAITMKDGYPVIDRRQCIACFCCQEFCHKGAMKVYRPLISRILTKKGDK